MTDSTTDIARRTVYRSTAQELTDGMREFLERQTFAMLATYHPDGSIHVVPLSYIFEDGRFFFATSSSSRKARNLVARPEATVTVDDRSTLEWVSATGTPEAHSRPALQADQRPVVSPVLDGGGP